MGVEPKTQRQFGCWLNAWANLEAHRGKVGPDQRLSAAWTKGYRQAVSDIADVHHKLTPDWMAVWHGLGTPFTEDEEAA